MAVEKDREVNRDGLLEEDELDQIQGGVGEGYTTVKGEDGACGRYFPAMNQAKSGKCGSCFYFHPLEKETGYCSR